MNYKIEMAQGSLGRVLAVRLTPGTDVLLGLEQVCREAGIANGVLLSAVGSLAAARFYTATATNTKAGFGYTDPIEKSGPLELSSASGMICHDDEGAINLHVHITFSDRQGNAYSGHLIEGTPVLITMDVVLAEIEGLVMGRKYDEALAVPIFAPRQL
jgi:predicted DNA-binding protein with PD1-like motif